MEKVNITVIGAGVIGLSVAAELSKSYPEVCIIEKYPSFGQDTSSRNSEVIHAGLYYPEDSLKKKTCIEGRELLYGFCAKYNVAHKRIGKLVVAITMQELLDLENLFAHAKANGVEGLRFVTRDEIKNYEPHIRAEGAVYSPVTGIIDTHGYMKTLEAQCTSRGGLIAYNTELAAVEKDKDGYLLTVKDKDGQMQFTSRAVVNCAGLSSDKVSALAGLAKDEYRLKYCKGDYFRVSSSKAKYISRLVYPVPKKDRAGLGIHATLDMAGSMRLGPDDEYISQLRYEVDPKKAAAFYESTRSFLPFIEPGDLSPDTSGIRPKLQGEGESFRDFIIKDEAENGFPGFINLIGIESPGLTASLSIAKMVASLSAPYV